MAKRPRPSLIPNGQALYFFFISHEMNGRFPGVVRFPVTAQVMNTRRRAYAW
jgi:hypothetical protein